MMSIYIERFPTQFPKFICIVRWNSYDLVSTDKFPL